MDELHKKVIEMKLNGERDQTIADALSIKFNYVRFVLKKYNVKAPPGTRSKNAANKACDLDEIRYAGELHGTGLTYEEIADIMGKTRNQVYTLVRKSGVHFTEEQNSLARSTYKGQLVENVLELRKSGKKLEDIATYLGIRLSTVRYLCAKNDVKLTREQFSNNLRDYALEKVEEIIKMRIEHPEHTREELAVLSDTSLPFVKRVLSENEVTISPEQAQENSYRSKLESNPKAMEYMRSFITEDTYKKVSESLVVTYKNQSLRALKSYQSKRWWATLTNTDRIRYLDYRQKCYNESNKVKELNERRANQDPEDNPRSRYILEKIGFDSFDSLMHSYAANHNGKFLDRYVDVYTKVKWACDKDHKFLMRPGNVRSGQWCPRCAFHVSKQEDAVYTFVKQFYPTAIQGEYGLLDNTRFQLDIYIPELNKAIEFDGDIWHYVKEEDIERRLRKDEGCKQKGIELLRIKHSEYVENVDLVEKTILEFIGNPPLTFPLTVV